MGGPVYNPVRGVRFSPVLKSGIIVNPVFNVGLLVLDSDDFLCIGSFLL